MIFLLACPFINDRFPTFFMISKLIGDPLKTVSFLILLGMLIKQKRRPSPLFFVLLAMQLWWLIITVFNYPDFDLQVFMKAAYDILDALSLAMIVELFARDPETLLGGLILNYEIALYPFFLMNVTHFLAEDYYAKGVLNTLILWLVPALVISLLRLSDKKNDLRSMILFFVCIYIVISIRSTTALLSVAAFLSVALIQTLLKRTGIRIPLLLLVVLAFLFNILILYAYTGEGIGLIDYVLVNILGKSASFTERDVIWKEAIRMIKTQVIFGHGYWPLIHVTNSFGSVFVHAHNMLLQVLNASGLIGLFFFVSFHVFLCMKVDSFKNSFVRSALMGAVFGICLTYITEAYLSFNLLYLVFFLGYHGDKFIKTDDSF